MLSKYLSNKQSCIKFANKAIFINTTFNEIKQKI